MIDADTICARCKKLIKSPDVEWSGFIIYNGVPYHDTCYLAGGEAALRVELTGEIEPRKD